MPINTLMPWPFEGRPLMKAEFIARPNRFIGEFRFSGDETIHRAHIADPGRLKELLTPGAIVYVVDYREHTTRKLPFAMPVVETHGGLLVSIYSRLPNAMFQYFFKSSPQIFSALQEYQYIRTEVPWQSSSDESEKSRFDFLLQSPKGVPTYIEVKGASLVEDKVCYFPDAVTARGAKQLRHLSEIARSGQEACVVFMIQRDDAEVFRPNWERDPVFAQALCDAHEAGVRINASTVSLTLEGISFGHTVPIELRPQ